MGSRFYAARRMAVAAITAVLVLAACASSEDAIDPTPPASTPPESAEAAPAEATPSASPETNSGPEPAAETSLLGSPPEVVAHADDWPLPNRDLAATRAVFNSPINSTTVDRLEVAWTGDVPGGSTWGNLATSPLILGDRVFVAGLDGGVHAFDATTGENLWTAGNRGGMYGPSGAAVGWGKVFAIKIGNRLRGQMVAAHDADTGEEIWATEIADGGSELNVQPFVHDGMVFASTSGFPAGVRGTIYALDQATGDVVWTFATVEDESLWGNPDINSGGGAWYPPALDPDSGTLFYGVGNPYPFPGAPGWPAGSSRPGDNRWTSGTVALDVKTGELRWGFQAFPHDIFDRDHVLVTLAEAEDHGLDHDVLVSAGKGGVAFGHDPATGEVLWRTSVGVHRNDNLNGFSAPVEVLPGAQGGMVTPVAVADGVFYAAVVNAPSYYESDQVTSGGEGTQLFTRPSNVVAIDIATGDIVWDVEIISKLPEVPSADVLGGMTVVNDLLFTSAFFGELLALDRHTGEVVWRHQAQGATNGWPSVAGDMIIYPIGLVEEPQVPHLLALRLKQ
ncbi:PQQ-binding-like beta-propeller repeat protein [Candidatus Poriferisocius sp.]|uniref:outer membrane protein assembly factor BamB family protein n=1 Tax=Candidatus Poriferisocius sp. TaxID=3101276 RepID=UPI003B02946B